MLPRLQWYLGGRQHTSFPGQVLLLSTPHISSLRKKPSSTWCWRSSFPRVFFDGYSLLNSLSVAQVQSEANNTLLQQGHYFLNLFSMDPPVVVKMWKYPAQTNLTPEHRTLPLTATCHWEDNSDFTLSLQGTLRSLDGKHFTRKDYIMQTHVFTCHHSFITQNASAVTQLSLTWDCSISFPAGSRLIRNVCNVSAIWKICLVWLGCLENGSRGDETNCTVRMGEKGACSAMQKTYQWSAATKKNTQQTKTV